MTTAQIKRVAVFVFVLMTAFLLGSSSVSAHPLGNFTTNTATRIVLSGDSVKLLYVVDLAEIPALKVRQSLNAATGEVPVAVSTTWRTATCDTLGKALSFAADEVLIALRATTSHVTFPPGQAGLTTLRLECTFDGAVAPKTGSKYRFQFADANFPDRLGWREITVVGAGRQATEAVASVSPTELLTKYPSGAVTSPLHQKSLSFTMKLGTAMKSEAKQLATNETTNRGNDGLTQRFQSLVARREVSLPFAIAAMLIALVLGGLHALAPGHGKTIMAAYAVSRRGRRGDILSIGLTVALTHTFGILALGTIISATSVVSSEGALRWASVASGILVTSVGVSLVRSRVNAARSIRNEKARSSHSHDHHEHQYDHDHTHDHTHDHHGQPHPHESDRRFVTTSHAHGGWQHEHVLPAPGAMVRRRELIAMGLAGGMVPSPSALVVLLAAIALGRIPFGLALVAAYGVGLALTLVAAGLLLVRFEQSVRRWGSRRETPIGVGVNRIVEALPLVSGSAIVGAGLLLVIRSMSLF